MIKLNFEVLDKSEKKKFLKELEIYGIEKLPYLIIKWGKRLRMFSGSIDKGTLYYIFKQINVDSIGLYFASPEEDGLRLSLDALHNLKEQIKDGFIELNDEQAEQWFRGRDVELDERQKMEVSKIENNMIILKNNEDLIGMGKKSFKGITNFMPKERRIK